MAGAALFVVAEAAIVLAFLPRSLGAIVAGALFGVPLGTALTWVAMTLGASIAFSLARATARLRARALARVAPWVTRLDRHLERRGLLSLLYTRLIPGCRSAASTTPPG